MLRHINPASMFKPAHYTQVVAGTGSTVFVSGQVAFDVDGNVVGKGDLDLQARQAYRNLGIALDSIGAGPGDIAKLTTYVVGYRPEMGPLLRGIRAEFLGDSALPAATLVGVESLAQPDLLFEVDAIAVIGE